MNKPTVSVIIPTYNRAHLLPRAIESVLNQTYQVFEVIIIDDGSTDKTREVVKSFTTPNIKYIKFEKNKGAAAARNIGINVARGEFIAFQDSDNEWCREKLTKQVELFKDTPSRLGVIYSGIWRIKNNKKNYVPSDKISKTEGNIYEMILMGNFIDLSAAIVKKECFSEVGLFDESLPCLQDWELWIRISKRYDFKYLKEPLVNAYYTSDSISINYGKLIVAVEYILNKHFDEFKKYKRALVKRYIYLAHLVYLSGDTGRGRRYLLKALRKYPLNMKSLLFLLLSFLGKNLYKNLFQEFYKI